MVVAGTVIAIIVWVTSIAVEREGERAKCMPRDGWQHDEQSQKVSQTCSVLIFLFPHIPNHVTEAVFQMIGRNAH